MRLYSWLDLFAARIRRVFRRRRPSQRPRRRPRTAGPGLTFERLEERVLLSAPNPFNLSGLDGLNGFTLDGMAIGDQMGWSVRSAGDVNNDGFDDLIIGAPNALTLSGQAYVVFGKADWSATPVFDLNTLDGTNGFRIDGQAGGERTGFSVTGIGDMNGDGIHDIAVSQPTAAPGGTASAGRIYVIWGRNNWLPVMTTPTSGIFNLAILDNATTQDTFGGTGIRIQGFQAGAQAGYSIANIGDIDGDGYNDFLVGSPRFDNNGTGNPEALHGQAYIIFGKEIGTNNSGGWFDEALVNLNGLGANGFTFSVANNALPTAGEAFDQLGYFVAGIGDINGDGRADLAISAPYGEPPGGDDNAGQIYVIFGNERGALTGITNTAALNGSNGFRLEGVEIGDYAGWSLAGVGDVNGDGFDDFAIGAPFADPGGKLQAGTTYVVFGRADYLPVLVNAVLDLNTLDGFRGFKIHGENTGDYSGWSVGGAGDVDGDGFDDILIGAPGHNSYTGRVYVMFGRKTGFDQNMLLIDLDGNTGFKINGIAAGDRAGFSVANAGDVNGDGFDDILIGARNAYSTVATGIAGQTYVVFGGNFRPNPGTQVGTAGNDTLDAGTNPANRDFLIGGRGSDTLISDGGPDVLRGGGGSPPTMTDDLLVVPDANFFIPTGGPNGNPFTTRRLVGGLGRDTIIFMGTSTMLDLTQIPDNRIQGIEVIDLRAGVDIRGNGNTLVVTPLEVRNLSTTGNTLTVRRGISDLVTGPGGVALENAGWSRSYDVLDNNPTSSTFGVTFRVYSSGAGVGTARLLVEDPAVLNFVQLDGYDPTTGDPSGTQLNGRPGVSLFGEVAQDFSAAAVAGVGDVNGDGFDDFLIGGYGADPGGNSSAGAVYLVFGKAGPWTPTMDLAGSVIDGVNVVKLEGIRPDDLAGSAVNTLGDVNGDGFGDFIIGAHRADRNPPPPDTSEGEAYVVLGKADWSATPTFQLSSLDGTNGFILRGNKPNDFAGFWVGGGGDANGDGYSDLLVGAFQTDPNAVNPGDDTVDGSTYLLFGGAFLAQLDALDGTADGKINLHLVDGIRGVRFDGVNNFDRSGRQVNFAGDVNGDGFADLLIGAHGVDVDPSANLATDEGAAYLIFGKKDWSSTPVVPLSTLDGTNGVRFNGENLGDWAGWSVSHAGDVNGDGFDDFIIGAYKFDANGVDSGRAYVVFGRADWSSFGTAGFNLGTLNGTNGFIVNGFRQFDYAGWSVTGIGDFNGDGFDDLVVGARRAEAHANGLGTIIGNGLNSTGQGYLIFGQADWSAVPLFDPAANNGTFITGLNAIRLDGIGAFDYATRSIRGAGDVNGDGFDDLLVGAYKDGPLGRVYAGTTYLVFGSRLWGTALPTVGVGTSGNDTLPATAGNTVADLLVGRQGNDTLTSDGGPDVLRGGQGNDLLELTNVDFTGTRRIDGGRGINTLQLAGLFGTTLDLTSIPDNRIQNIQIIDITGIGNNTLRLNVREVLNMAVGGRDPILGQGTGESISNTLTVFRDRGDVVDITDLVDWTVAANAEWDPNVNAFFVVFQNGAARLRVQSTEVVIVGSTADVLGGDGDDVFLFDALTNVLTVNGVAYDLNLAGAINFVTIDGGAGLDSFVGFATAGNDLLVRDNGGVVRFEHNPGHAGFDVVGVNIERATMDGRGGIDTIRLDGSGLGFNMASAFGSQTLNVEFLNITGTGNNSLTLSTTSVVNNGANPLTVFRNNGDVVNVGAGWTKSPSAFFDGTNYFEVYTFGSQVLRVQSPAVTLSGSTALVNGTSGNDVFIYDANTNVITINGVAHALPGTVNFVFLDGQAGFDQLSLIGTPNNDKVVLQPTSVNFEFNPAHAGFDFQGINLEKFIVDGRGQTGGSGDQAFLFDSAGDNLLTLNPLSATMTGGGVDHFVTNFETIVGNSAAGGTDTAVLNDSAGNDVFFARSKLANLSGPGFFNQASGFRNINGRALNGGNDTAFLLDAGGNNVFSANAATRVAQMSGANFTNTALQFETVSGQASFPSGGVDTAFLFDSAGNDVFVSRRLVAFLRTAGGDFYEAQQFEKVSGRAVAGGFDQAFLFDNPGNDTFTGTETSAVLVPNVLSGGPGEYREALGFEVAAGLSTEGGSDLAILFDTPGQDVLSITPTVANFSRPGTGLYLQAQGFKTVSGRSVNGGNDFAFLMGSAGNDTFTAQPNMATFVGPGSTPLFTMEVTGFRTISARSGGGIDVAHLFDSAGNDTYTTNGTTGVATLQGAGYFNETISFRQVFANASTGNDTAHMTDSPGDDLFFARLSNGFMSGPGYHYAFSGFDTTADVVSILGVTGGTNTLDAINLQFTLNVISSWVVV